MTLFILCYFAGILTILSPCILPVLPFVFASAQKSFRKGSLPLLLGMSLTFSGFSALALIGGEWVVQANQWGRFLALGFLGVFALSLLWPELSAKIFAPLVTLGSRFGSPSMAAGQGPNFGSSFGMGVSTGLLWAPCAGPVLGLVLTGAAVQKSLSTSVLLLLCYSLGASTSLGLALVSGQRFLAPLKKALGVDQVIKKILGALVLAGVLVIAFGLDRQILGPLSKIETAGLETKLLDYFQPAPKVVESAKAAHLAPEFKPGLTWINSQPLKMGDLKGKVVLIDFWTYSCINCLRTLPYVKEWAAKYRDQGLVVIGVHTPEFGFEKNLQNVQKAVQELGVTYPVVLDNDYEIWNSYQNRYWPAHYFIDRDGQIREHHFGEGHYAESEVWIQQLLKGDRLGGEMNSIPAEKGADSAEVITPETYLGLGKTHTLKAKPAAREDQMTKYQKIQNLALNEWSVEGLWSLSDTEIHSGAGPTKLQIHFKAHQVNLVMGSARPVAFKVYLDGKALQQGFGRDVDPQGHGKVQEHRLYNLLQQDSMAPLSDHVLEIDYEGAGVDAFSWTFG